MRCARRSDLAHLTWLDCAKERDQRLRLTFSKAAAPASLFHHHKALEDRELVERAKGLLMSALGLSEQDAFRRLQITARERNLRLADVAARIVEQQGLLEPKRKQPST
jgi:hypothetical protein